MAETMVTESAVRIFADVADPQTLNSARDSAWKAPLWRSLEESGLTLAWVPEALGGAGASLAEGFEVLAAAGRYAVPAPLAETLLAGWLLARAGLRAPAGTMTVAPARPADRIALESNGTLSGRAGSVPFASEARHVAVLAHGATGAHVALVETRACEISGRTNLAGDACDEIVFGKVKASALAAAPGGLDEMTLMLMGSTVRAVQSAGALAAILDLALRYADERVAFERKIGKFQAVQHNLARLAGEVSAALCASGSAADAIARGAAFEDELLLEAAAAKIRCAAAAQEGAAIAHQVFGAIGYSEEHILHRYTLRLLGWRDDFGNESHWAAELGRRVARRGAEALWPLVASR